MSVTLAAASFSYPFRPGWGRVWAVGVALAFVCPIGVVPLLGYSVAATRASLAGADDLPAWRLDGRLLLDGALLLALLAVVTAPFGAAVGIGSGFLAPALPVRDPALARAYGSVAVGIPVAVLWAFAALVVVPCGVVRYAQTRRPLDLFNAAASARTVRRRFWAWNVAGVPIVTAWAITCLAVPAGVVGAPFAAVYAILVSAHACSTLADQAPG